MIVKPCWLCEGKGRHNFEYIVGGVPCGLCNGKGWYEPRPQRPQIMAIVGRIQVSGKFELTKEDAMWALAWAEATREE